MPLPTNTNLRRTDLCTCGKPRSAHGGLDSLGHNFVPHPQPPALPTTSEFTHITAWRTGGIWRADVSRLAAAGHGQASTWLAAVEAAIEDLKEKS